MTHFRNSNHYTVFGWMIHKLGLKDANLIIYAIVYSFSQEGETEFYGGRKFMAEASARSLATVDRILVELEKAGLIKKLERENDGVSHCRYKAFVDDEGEGIFNPEMKKNDDNTSYYDDNTPYHDNNTPYHDNNTYNKDNININKRKSISTLAPEEVEHNRWFAEQFPTLALNKRPLKLKTYIALKAEYPTKEILLKLNEMEAKKDFNRKYSDVGRVLYNWLERDKDPNHFRRVSKNNDSQTSSK